MSIKGFRRLLLGDKMPDKDDPKYKARYEREVEAGKKFAKFTRIDKVACGINNFANKHRVLFLVIVFGILIGCFILNIYRINAAYKHTTTSRDPSAIERQDSILQEKLNKATEKKIKLKMKSDEDNR